MKDMSQLLSRWKGSQLPKYMSIYLRQINNLGVTNSDWRGISDITTNTIIRQLSDENYKTLFAAFYKPMSRVLEQYCKYKKYSHETDIVLYYKGGNVFRILLSDLVDILGNEDYKALMKRSDADFQIYINPLLPNPNVIREEVSILVTYVLHNFRIFMRKSGTTRISDESQLENIKTDYIAELHKHNIQVSSLEVKTKKLASRQDLMISMGKIVPSADTEFVLVQRFSSLVDGLEARPSTYFISRNTALSFKRKDDLCATFDLIRFRRNFKLHVSLKTGEEVDVNAPFEIIDVSIPHSNDFGLQKLVGNVQNLLKSYTFKTGKRSFTFRAPTVSYQLKDLHDVLFKQNEFPWLDIKYDKRITRYFLSIIVYDIVEGLSKQTSIIRVLDIPRQSEFVTPKLFIWQRYIDMYLGNWLPFHLLRS